MAVKAKGNMMQAANGRIRTMTDRKICRGDVYYVDKYPTCGSEQQASRPGIIVSNNIINATSPVVEVVYLTTQIKRHAPTHVEVRSTGRASIALCEQITTVSVERLSNFKCRLTPDEMNMIDRALAQSVSILYNHSETEKGIPDDPTDERFLAIVCLRYLQSILGNKVTPDLLITAILDGQK